MPQNRKWLQVAVSLVMAIIFVNYFLKAKERNIENGYEMVTVLASARDIPPKTRLTDDMLTTKDVPLKFMEPGAVQIKYPGQELASIADKVSIAPIAAGAQIVQSNLNYPDVKTNGVAIAIPPGRRGVLLHLGNMDIATLILPGDHVDVLATFTVHTKGQDATSKATYTILQNILVVSVGKDIRTTNEDAVSKKETGDALLLTLALTPIEAEKISLAQSESQGDINVIVRGRSDNSTPTLPGINPGNILGG